MEPPKTPPREPGSLPKAPTTPEQVRQMEISRLKAKALRDQQEPASTGTKRPFSAVSRSAVPSTNRDASGPARPKDDGIRPAKKFDKYIEYDFSKMTDTKGGFLSSTDDPHNKALHSNRGREEEDQRPAHMTVAEWERHQLLRKLRENRAGPFEPGVSEAKKCRECGSLEIDWKWEDVFGCRVCSACKEKFQEKYSLLTKTEAKEDYLLTDPELKDDELFPRLERPNPHKSTWNNMQLYLRYQLEEYAFSDRKWGSTEGLDAEFERRESDKKQRKEKKFNAKLDDLKKRTRFDAYKRNRSRDGHSEAHFGDRIRGRQDKHVHEWGRAVHDPDTGMSVKTCVECGMEVEELEL
ncbi:XPA protein C-terminus-domain-containing protein [Lineolata rhizophorae]|uniref:DNA repair protein RAD14 n=1 Tax=Lineolata rhizophorae TaxID=578093 RepID=A0A6A6NZJ6_9PEZI|nr:XPA protein C-terminus-domain-containing protein [Lineolata rhizophorae]